MNNIKAGDKIKHAGIDCLVLEVRENALFCLADKILFQKAFDGDDYNNWTKSSLRKHLNGEWLNKLSGKEAFLPIERDLLSDDGLKDYGTCEDRISLLSYDEYRKHRAIIGTKDNWWWLLTPWSCAKDATHAGGYNVRCVASDGCVSNATAFAGFFGVCPAFLLDKSAINNSDKKGLKARITALEKELKAIKEELNRE